MGDERERERLRRSPSPGAIVAALAIGGLTSSFMQTIIIPIQYELPTLLDAPRSDTAWVVTITLLTAAVTTPIAGRLGDMFGKRRIALAVLAIMVVGCVVAATSHDIVGMIIGRGLQGVGMGILPLGISIMRDVLPERRLGSGIALMSATMGIGGAVGLGSAATLFLGMIEAPLIIRPYLPRFSRSDFFVLFTVGLASVAGTVFVLYATILAPVVPGALGHILVASVMSLPAGIMIARIMIPGEADTESAAVAADISYRSSMDAVARGTADGLQLWLGIVAMLLVMVALVALADIILGHLPAVAGAPLSAERIFGWAFAPVVWLYGVPWNEAMTAGALMGDKTIINEFVAYMKLAALPDGALSPRARLIMLYAMCGFANFGSVGILIAGVGGLAPERRDEIVPLALRALLSGTMASGLTGAIIGFLPVA